MSGPGPVATFLLVGGAILILLGFLYLARRATSVSRGARVVALDRPSLPGPLLRSARWRLAGRPDALLERADGTPIPLELKSRAAPRRGPPASHVAQIAAYAALVEEATGRSPPYGVLRYGDGTEFRIPWDDATRRWLWSLRRELDRPYDGRATPSPGRCRGCRFRSVCDASQASSARRRVEETSVR